MVIRLALARRAVAFLLFSSLFLIGVKQALAQEDQDLHWRKLPFDLDVMDFKDSSSLFSGRLYFFRAPLKNLALRVIRAQEYGMKRASVKTLVNKSHAVFGINANFFDQNFSPLGLVLSSGRIFQGIHAGGKTLTGIFQMTSNGPRIIQRTEFTPMHVLEAVQAGPRLISGNIPVLGIREQGSQRRSGVCIDSEQNLIFYISPDALTGSSISDLQNLLTRSEIGCRDALNLDGGGSAQIYAKTVSEEFDFPGLDEVPVILALIPQKNTLD